MAQCYRNQKIFSDLKYKYSREQMQPFKLKMIEFLIKERKGSYILDVGCGSGIFSKIMQENGYFPIGLDISTVALEKYLSNRLEGIAADVENAMPIKDCSVDIVWLSEVIEHIKNYDNLLNEIYRVLKPGGKLFLTTPNSAFFVYRLLYLFGKLPAELQHPHHLRFFNYRILTKLLKEKKFTIEKIFGQNIYAVIPVALINKIYKKNKILGNLMEKIIKALGFKRSEGYIHGDKYLMFSFSKILHSFFSNTIMLIAKKK